MTATRLTLIHCDKPGCDEITYGVSAHVAREGARRAGWRVNVEAWGRTRHDYCLKHSASREKGGGS